MRREKCDISDISKRIYSYLSHITIFQYVERVGLLFSHQKKQKKNLRISESYIYLPSSKRGGSKRDLTLPSSPPFGDPRPTRLLLGHASITANSGLG